MFRTLPQRSLGKRIDVGLQVKNRGVSGLTQFSRRKFRGVGGEVFPRRQGRDPAVVGIYSPSGRTQRKRGSRTGGLKIDGTIERLRKFT